MEFEEWWAKQTEIVSSSRMDGVEFNELLKRGAKACGFDLHWHSDGKLDITQKQLEQFAFYLTTAGRRDALRAAGDPYMGRSAWGA